MELITNHVLPEDMSMCDSRDDWTPAFQDAVVDLLEHGADRVAVEDFVDTLRTGSQPAESASKLVADVAGHCSPSDAFYAWETSREWAAIIRLDSLADVIGDNTAWNGTLRRHSEYWLVDHGRLPQIIRVAALAGRLARVPCSRDQAVDLALDLCGVVKPQRLAQAWRQTDAEEAAASDSMNTRWVRSWARALGLLQTNSGRLPDYLKRQYRDEVLGMASRGRPLQPD
jgi:hypothetical protein